MVPQKIKSPSDRISDFYQTRNWKIPAFQQECWDFILNGTSGLLNAPTGSGKTYAIWLGLLIKGMQNPRSSKKLRVIWITPLKALSRDIADSMQLAASETQSGYTVATRTGDTSTSERAKLRRSPPEALITTPESLHLLLTYKDYNETLNELDAIIIDEWHELIGNKRGVQIELAISRLKAINPNLMIWGISATIGNLKQAMDVLLGSHSSGVLVQSKIQKVPEIISLIPDAIERFPWSGHMGLHLIDKVFDVINKSKTTLLFTNTRNQAERWYMALIENYPDLMGSIAMHHGSVSKELRTWVEDALHQGSLKVVVCTSSLDLGVDFRPVDTVIQIGSPKGVARFLQRAGRSGHRPDAQSKVWFVPANALELMEAAALKEAAVNSLIEARVPIELPYDVLIQYMVTLSLSTGFNADDLYHEVRKTFAFRKLDIHEWNKLIVFLTTGGKAFAAYPEFSRIKLEDNLFKISSKSLAMRHRMHIGTIVSDATLAVKFQHGGNIGTVEEWFVSKLKPGDVFWFAGRALELIRIRDLQVFVKKSSASKGVIPAWMGGRMPLSSMLSEILRKKITQYVHTRHLDSIEMKAIKPILDVQESRSFLPHDEAFVIESFKSNEGYHIFMYPFEGRFVHEALGSLIAYRISQMVPISFSIAMNDYGFELLSDKPIPIIEAIEENVFSPENIYHDLMKSLDAASLASRRFRDIASIAGLIFQGFPGKNIGAKHLQASSRLLFDVTQQYDPNNPLITQAFHEVMTYQLESHRLIEALNRIQNTEIKFAYPDKPTPFSFPIMVDRLRQKLSSETVEDRIRKMQIELEK